MGSVRVEEPTEKYFDQSFGLPDADLARVRERNAWDGIGGHVAGPNQIMINNFSVRRQSRSMRAPGVRRSAAQAVLIQRKPLRDLR